MRLMLARCMPSMPPIRARLQTPSQRPIFAPTTATTLRATLPLGLTYTCHPLSSVSTSASADSHSTPLTLASSRTFAVSRPRSPASVHHGATSSLKTKFCSTSTHKTSATTMAPDQAPNSKATSCSPSSQPFSSALPTVRTRPTPTTTRPLPSNRTV